MTNDVDHDDRAFFGRRKGKALRDGQSHLIEHVLPHLRLPEGAIADLHALFPQAVEAVRLEIGFGGGEHLLMRMRESPQIGFIGVEPFINGMAKMLAALDREPRENLRLYDEDATAVLDWLPDASLAGVDLFYPDPWHKRRHWKRRFVSDANLDRFARVLKPGGKFRFASDIEHYVNWTLQHCRRHDAFDWQAEGPSDWNDAYDGWPGTRYEAKAFREGRRAAYLTFIRR